MMRPPPGSTLFPYTTPFRSRRDPAPVRSPLFIPPQGPEVGAIGGWPETRRDPAPVRSPLFIPPEVREVGAIGGWPETRRDPAPVLSALFIPPGDRETGTLRGWPDKGTTRLRYARAFTPGGRGRRGATRLRSASRSSLHAFHRSQGAHYSIGSSLSRTRRHPAATRASTLSAP